MAEASTEHDDKNRLKSRRDFLSFIPLALLAGMAATIAAAAFRFLRPTQIFEEAKWTDIGPLSQFTGDKPIMRSVSTERAAGWASMVEEHFVFVLPDKNYQVLSAACPHEGCNVVWRDEDKNFFCPCHDSLFAADGSRVSGPSRRGLDPLPSEQENGVLKVKYQSYVNNTNERVVRG
ncbi:MAG TPA: Rieske (2Fe-2S) protein [Pyrinomonadaceae bacterium]|nr:Rieske (2Fe-2S) protein [Pyrinomonadaceae bacterium]